jgi:LPXTG-motif cell wall-anchored protein
VFSSPSLSRRLLVLTLFVAAIGLPALSSGSPVNAQVCPGVLTQGDLTTEISEGGTSFVVHQFTSPGAATFTAPPTVTEIEYLVVGGGGGGGGRYGGGGGGGGFVSGTISVSPGVAIDVTVGAGGIGGPKRTGGISPGRGSNGLSSSLGTLEAIGGGGGGAGNQGDPNGKGRDGASGGGGGGTIEASATLVGGAGTQGSAGGNGGRGVSSNDFTGLTAGGGGGAGGVGGTSAPSSSVAGTPGLAGAGGIGLNSTISGVSLGYAGGGGGGAYKFNNPNNGNDGGGNGTNSNVQPTKALRGGGGGGGGLAVQGEDGSAGGDGGDGLVIIRYVAPPLRPCDPTITSVAARDGAALVSFTAPSSDGGATITNYEYSSDGGLTWTAFSPPVVSSPVIISGLTNATVSAMVLRAVNVMGAGSPSNIMEVTPQVVVPPSTNAPAVTTPTTTTAPVQPPSGAPSPPTVPPALSPGEVLVLRNGVAVPSLVVAPDASSLTLLHEDSELRVTARCEVACPVSATGFRTGLAIEVHTEAELLLVATGFVPHSTVEVWVFSEPQLLARSVLGANGSFTEAIALTTVAVGQHTLQVNSTSPTGDQLSFHLSLIVHSAASSANAATVLPQTGISHLMAMGTSAIISSLAGILLLTRRRRAGEMSL